MKCRTCASPNDSDAALCSSCGRPLADETPRPARRLRAYLFALLLIPVLLVVVGVGYYKFVLPDGVAAVVNGEEIRQSELDEEVARLLNVQGASGAEALRKLRYDALSGLIRERLLLQEARKAGVQASDAGAGRWFSDVMAGAAVRISLAEQWSGSGCGCCSGALQKSGGGTLSPEKEQAAADAGLRYWREKHGDEAVTAHVSDFGCHLRIDILKDGRLVGSLRLQNGRISEM